MQFFGKNFGLVKMLDLRHDMVMKFDIITIFPQILDSYFAEAQVKRAIGKKLVTVKTHDLRKYAEDKHHTTDDLPYGGGAGMVMKVEPIDKNIVAILKKSRFKRKGVRVILLGAKGKFFNQKKPGNWRKNINSLS